MAYVRINNPGNLHAGSLSAGSITNGGCVAGGFGTTTVTLPVTGGGIVSSITGAVSSNTYNFGPAVNIHSDGIDLSSNADIKIGNQSLKETLQTIQDRLSILVPDPAKLEKYAALKAAYEHYKLMESLINDAD